MKKYIAEGIGTFLLVLFGCGSVASFNTMFQSSGLSAGVITGASTLGIAFVFGLVFIAIYYSIGKVSACHINPSVSIAMWVSNKMETKDFAWYVISQVIGAIIGALMVSMFFGSTQNIGANGFGEFSSMNTSMMTAILVEIILTCVFVLVVLTMTSKEEKSQLSGLIIGLTLTLVHLFGIPFTGTSVNPARSLGPAIISGKEALAQLWVFILSPLAGAVLAAILYKVFLEKGKLLDIFKNTIKGKKK